MANFRTTTLTLLLVGFISVVATDETERSEANVSFVKHVNDDTESNAFRLKVDAFNTTYEVRVNQAPPIFARHFREYVVDSNETVRELPEKDKIHEAIQANVFTDDSGATSVHVTSKNGKLYVEGLVNDHIRLEPLAPEGDRNPRHVAYRSQTLMYAVANATSHTNVNVNRTANDPAERNQMPGTIHPELLVFYDYNISSYYQFDREKLKKYIAIFYNAVNRRLGTIGSPNIQLVITGIVVTKQAHKQQFSTSKYLGMGTIDGKQTLRKIGDWLRRQKKIILRYDITYFHTALDIAIKTELGWRREAKGLSYLGGVCQKSSKTIYSLGIGVDVAGTYHGTGTATHGLAHILGADHDGKKNYPPSSGNPAGIGCKWSDGYIMSFELTRNKFAFSKCSQAAIRYVLSSPKAKCVWDQPKSGLVQFNPTMPGEIITLNQQCEGTFGLGYAQVNNDDTNSDVCEQLWCLNANNPKDMLSSTPAYEGSPCDTDKWCINGQCVVNPAWKKQATSKKTLNNVVDIPQLPRFIKGFSIGRHQIDLDKL